MITDYHDNFSIVVPTFCEAKNISELIKRIAQVDFGKRLFEVILVDDNSRDGTAEIVTNLQADYPWLGLIVRMEQKSLSASAMEGFQAAKFPIVVLMDADLSHPPEKIPQMLAVLRDPRVDFVIGSRYISGGSADEIWPVSRKISSRFAALIAQLLLFKRIKDPLSGFFALRKHTLVLSKQLKPVGWKIGLELMLKCRCKNIKEIPIHFSERLYGKSKFNLRVIYEYLCHVKQLLLFKIFS